MICMLCRRDEPPSAEHIVPESLGGRRTTKALLCEDCNNKLGHDVDAPLAQTLLALTLLWGNPRGDDKPAPPLRGVTTTSGMSVTLHSGGVNTIEVDEPFRLEPRDGGVAVRLEAATLEKIAQLMVNVLIKEGRTIDELREQSFARTTHELGGHQLDFRFNDPNHGRSVAKMGLAALAKKLGREALEWPPLRGVSGFITGGAEGSRRRHFVHARIREEAREHCRVDSGDHALLVFNSPRTLECVFLAFGAIPFRARLADERLPELEHAVLHRVRPRARQHEIEDAAPPTFWRCFAFERRTSRQNERELELALTDALADASHQMSLRPKPTLADIEADAVRIVDLVEETLTTATHRKKFDRAALVECARGIVFGLQDAPSENPPAE